MTDDLNTNVIARTVVRSGHVVSTILLAPEIKVMDSVLGTLGAALQDERYKQFACGGDYETMVFTCDADGDVTNWTEVDFARYGTKDAALLGHEAMVATWNAKAPCGSLEQLGHDLAADEFSRRV